MCVWRGGGFTPHNHCQCDIIPKAEGDREITGIIFTDGGKPFSYTYCNEVEPQATSLLKHTR